MFLELSDLTTETMWQRAAADQIDIAILPKSLEARFKGFQWVELQRLAPVLVVSKKNPLTKLTKIHPEKLRDKMMWLGVLEVGCLLVSVIESLLLRMSGCDHRGPLAQKLKSRSAGRSFTAQNGKLGATLRGK